MPERTTVTIRPMRVEDLDEVIELKDQVAAEGRWIATEAPIDREDHRVRYSKGIDDERVGSFVAVDGDRIVGNLGIELASYGVAEFGMLVAADQRGRGVGRALLAAGIDWARAAGAHKVALQRWPVNEAAQALYERFGFVEEGYLRRHYRRKDGSLWDAVVMGLVLDQDAPGMPDFDP
jgi:putative acetyltransferase